MAHSGMRFFVVAASAVVGSLLLGIGAASGSITTSTALALAPPVIHEQFTLLDCNQSNQLGMEGCEEHKIIKLDKVIDQGEQVLFGMLKAEGALYGPKLGPSLASQAESDLIEAESAWFAYRVAQCNSQSDSYLGGSVAPLISAECQVQFDQSRIGQLRSFYRSLGGVKKPPFPKG